jgi:hypothetical protein
MDIADLIFNLQNPSTDVHENHDTMLHAASLIKLMQDRIAYLSDNNLALQDKVDRLSLDLGLKDMGLDK